MFEHCKHWNNVLDVTRILEYIDVYNLKRKQSNVAYINTLT